MLTGWLKALTGSYEAPMIAILVFLLIGVVAYYALARQRFVPSAKVIPLDYSTEPA